MKRLLLFLFLCWPAAAFAQGSMSQVPIPPVTSQIGFTATSSDQTVVSATVQGVVRTILTIQNYGSPDYPSNATIWVTFGQPCVAGQNGALQIVQGGQQTFGGVRAQNSAQNVPQESVHVCTSSSTAVGSIIVQ
jgi:hypothetical protein